MDRNTIVGLLLIGVIFLGYSYYNNSKLEKAYTKEIARADSLLTLKDYDQALIAYRKAKTYRPKEIYPQMKINEINKVAGYTTAPVDTSRAITTPKNKSVGTQSPQAAQKQQDFPAGNTQQLGAFSKAAQGEQRFITMENDLLKVKIATRGGRLYYADLKKYHTFDTLPLVLFNGDSTKFGFQFFTADNHAIETNNLYFKPLTDKKHFVADTGAVSLTMRLEIAENKYIDYTYTLKPNDYMIDYNLEIVGMKDVFARGINSVDLSWNMYLPKQEKGRQNEDYYAAIKYKYYGGDVDGFRERSNKAEEERNVSNRISWLAFKDQFFSSVLIGDKPFLNAWVKSTKTPDLKKYLRYYEAKLAVPYTGQKDEIFKMRFYLGPNKFTTLNKYGIGLENLVYLGKNIIRWINQYVIIVMFNWLNKFIGNYGIIILLLTIIIKMVLFPLTYKSFLSQAKMRVLKPQVDAISAKFPKKEDAMKKQQATMGLYKKAGVSPLGGCLPMLLQMPILFAMFRFFPTSIELRQQSFLWATDLSTYDSILTLPFNIPMYGSHVSLFTLLMTVSTIVTMKINSPTQSGSSQMPGMKGMTYIMPLFFMLILNNYSAGLTYYYFLANLITFGQNMLTKQFVDEDAILKKLETNKKEPPKKSKWQQRLEQASKQKGYRPSRRR